MFAEARNRVSVLGYCSPGDGSGCGEAGCWVGLRGNGERVRGTAVGVGEAGCWVGLRGSGERMGGSGWGGGVVGSFI